MTERIAQAISYGLFVLITAALLTGAWHLSQ